jgi:hypothetical protein
MGSHSDFEQQPVFDWHLRRERHLDGAGARTGVPGATYSVSGSLTQTAGGAGAATTSLSFTGSSPSPSGYCYSAPYIYHYAVTESETMAISSDSCDNASGTWSNSDGFNGSATMSKPSDLPNLTPAQTSSAICWWDTYPCGTGYWSVVLFEDTLQSTKSMAGRQVYEGVGTAYDNCYFSNIYYAPYSLSGGGWYVGYYYFDSRTDFDYVGTQPGAPGFYRSAGRTPCTMGSTQPMWIYTYTGPAQYFTGALEVSIQPTWYGVEKNGIAAWRTY